MDKQSIMLQLVDQLSRVIDPETGVDVVKMRLVERLQISDEGHVAFTFRPSSPFCPMGLFLAQAIKTAVAAVPGVTGQTITVTDHIQADELNRLLNGQP